MKTNKAYYNVQVTRDGSNRNEVIMTPPLGDKDQKQYQAQASPATLLASR